MKRFVPFILLMLVLAFSVGSMPALAEAAAATAAASPAPTDSLTPPGETAEPEIVVTNPVVVDDLAQTQGLDSKWTNILLLGGDSRGSKDYARTDTMIVLSVNFESGEIKMASLMRDIWVDLKDVGWAKLNAANVYGGPKLLMRTVNENFGLNISQYAMINLTAMAEVVDKLGGVNIDISQEEMKYINEYLKSFIVPTLNTANLTTYGPDTLLTGNQVTAFTRNRYQDSDYVRTERNRRLLSALAKKLQSTTNLATIADVANTLLPYVDTNIDLTTLLKLAAVGLKADFSNTPQIRIPIDDSFESGMKDGTWSIRPDFAKNTQALHDFIYGSAN
jgi:LCP family protein required for cell wall assembly